ncbi:MAG: hypothetical protein OEV66_01480 [Spirochaetia bacterium]|nr:hypothetical protein [Spirochaetia bacterium]
MKLRNILLKRSLIWMISIFAGSVIYAMTPENEKSANIFLNAETSEARNMLSGFSNQFIEDFTAQYKTNLNAKESRKLWIMEEGFRRKSDQIASDRLFYVFLAVSLLVGLIFLLTLRIYQMQKKIGMPE